jgi:allantoin racemase
VKIKYIIPFPFDEEGIANRAAQLPAELRTPGVDYEFVTVKNSIYNADSAYELLLLDAYIAEAGVRSEDEGFDAVVMDTVSDSGLAALRSRLTIPVLGPGLVQQHVAAILGKRFSILTMWKRWVSMYEKQLAEYGTGQYCASIRSIDVRPDQEQLLAGKEEVVFGALEEQGRQAIEEDGADVILIGSTTMHQSVEHLRRTLGVPVINPGPLAIKLAELFVQLGLSHSKVAYMPPEHIQDEKLESLMAASDEAGVG